MRCRGGTTARAFEDQEMVVCAPFSNTFANWNALVFAA